MEYFNCTMHASTPMQFVKKVNPRYRMGSTPRYRMGSTPRYRMGPTLCNPDSLSPNDLALYSTTSK